MRESLTFGGVNLRSYGVYWDSSQTFDKPSKDVVFYQVPGRNGDLSVSRNRFNNIEISVDCFIEDFSRFDDLMNALYSFDGYQTLLLGDSPATQRQAQFINATAPTTTQLNRQGTFTLVFNCKPQRLITTGQTKYTAARVANVGADVTLGQYWFGSNFALPTTFQKSYPVIFIQQMTCNQITIQYANNEYANSVKRFILNKPATKADEIVIDCQTKSVYLQNGSMNYVAEVPASDYSIVDYWGDPVDEWPFFFKLARGPFFNVKVGTAEGDTGSCKVNLTPNWWIL